MAEFEKEWLEQYKSLETPKDIMQAIIGLSEQEGGAVMVRLENDKGLGIWLHARVLEDEVAGARKGYQMLMYSKLDGEIKDNGWKIKGIEPLEIDEHGRDYYRTDKFSQEHHCAKSDMRNSDFPYAGKYVDLPEGSDEKF